MSYDLIVFDWEGTLADGLQLFAGTKDFLQQLKAQGYILAVATGKSRAGLNWSLHQEELDHFFAFTITTDEAPAKPHPFMLTWLMEQTGVLPEKTLMVGDSSADMLMADVAGVSGVFINRSGGSQAGPSYACQKGVITDMADLSHYLSSTKR